MAFFSIRSAVGVARDPMTRLAELRRLASSRGTFVPPSVYVELVSLRERVDRLEAAQARGGRP